MPHNILMSKIRCYNPNKSHAALKNLNYIVYIGTRPGVDLTDVKLDELTAITEEDITPDEPSANSQYIYYIAKRQNSQGLFGNFEFNNITEVAHEVRDVTDAGVNVYRGIVSLSEEDAVVLGYNQKDAWVKYMHSVMNDVGNSFGIPLTALKWCAAVHMEQGHPHCHYTFWRTDGKVMSSYIHVSKQNEIREFLSGQMFKAEREMFLPEKNQYRDATIGAARSFMNSLDIDFNHIPERITQQQLQHMSSDLIELVNFLPGRGSLKYKLLPPKCKILVDKVVEDVIQIPAVNKEYTAYMKAVSDISKTYSGSTNHQATNQTVADEDIRKRLANSILKSAITLSLIQKKNLSGELSSPLHNDNLQVNSVHLYDEDNLQVNSVHLYDEDNLQVNSVHLYDEDSSQVNSVHLYDEDSSQVNSVHLYDEDSSQVNSVHLYDEDNPQVNSVHLSDEEFFRMSSGYLSNEDIPQMNSVHLSDEEFFRISSGYLSNEDIPQMNSVHLSDEEFFRMSSNYLSDEDVSQVNSVHLNDEDTSQVNSVHLINGKICNNVKQPKLEWTAAFKGTRNSLYSLDKEDPNYTTQFNTILDALISYHNQGYLPATYLLARLYNSKSYPIYDKEISDKLYTLSYNNFKNIFEHPELYISNHKEHKKGDNEKSVLTPEQQESFLSYHLGKMSERGLGCEINYNDAISYYKNCLNDNAYAQYALANIYLSEKTTPLTPELYAKSLKLLESASNKNPYAAYEYAQHLERPIFPYRSTQNEINSYYRTALDGFLSEEDNDTNLNGSILYKIGKLYYEGKGCERDVELAYNYFMKSAECKNKNAYYALGKTCSDKTSSHYDPVRAEQYYIKAYNEYTDPETGESHAPSYLKIAMADLYANQENDKIYDIDKAIDIYKECIETNADSTAMFKLGSLYLNGNGVDENVELGLKYINAAIDAGNKFVKITMAGIYSDSNNKLYNMDKAIELYKDCAENDSDSFSMFRLGSIYFNGNGVEKNTVLGLQYLNHAAKSGNKYAKITLAGIYSNGDNEFYDMAKAIRLYKDCAENEDEPDPFSMYRLGYIYLKGKGVEKDIELGLHYLNSAIDGGNSFAKITLADFYADSTHGMYDMAKAIQLYKDCAENEDEPDPFSMYKLGAIYIKGKGVEKNIELGLHYLNNAIDGENSFAKVTLADFYADSTHDMYDMAKAIQLYKDCAENEDEPDPFSMYKLGAIYIKGKGVEKNIELGLHYLNNAIDGGNSFAKVTLADFYADSTHDMYDIAKAIQLYKDCAENEDEPDPFSMYKLGSIYIKGNGVEKNIELGLHYLNNAIDGGNSFAKVTLADFYADSTHSWYNITKAIQLYKDCIKNDSDSYSMSRLGSIYLFGHGVDKDEALGLKYLNDAVANGNEHAKKTIEFYNNMKHSMAISASFSLAYHFLSALSDRRNQNHLLLIHSKPTSKEARIDAYKKSKEHSSPDFEH